MVPEASAQHPAMSERERNRKCLLRLLQRQHNFPLSLSPSFPRDAIKIWRSCAALAPQLSRRPRPRRRLRRSAERERGDCRCVDGVGCDMRGFFHGSVSLPVKHQTAYWRIAHG